MLIKADWLRDPEIFGALPATKEVLWSLKSTTKSKNAWTEGQARAAVRRKLLTPDTILSQLDRIKRRVSTEGQPEKLKAFFTYFGGKHGAALYYPDRSTTRL
jgi:hypothetical protein